MRVALRRASFATAVLAIAAALGAGGIAACFETRTRDAAPSNPRGEISPATSGAFTVVAFGDSKGRSAVLARAVADARAHAPSVLVHLGDFVEQNSDFEFRYASNLAAGVRASGVPFFVAIGNHEGFDRHDHLSRERYTERFGPPVSWFRAGGVLFVSLDTSDEKTFPEEQARAVDAILAAERPRSRHAVLVTHVPPLVSHPIKDKRGYTKQLPPEDSARIFSLVDRYGIELVLAGHYHGSFVEKKGATTYVIAGGGGATLDGPDEFHHYARAVFSEKGVSVAVVRVDDAPGLEWARYLVLKRLAGVLAVCGVLALAGLAIGIALGRRGPVR